MTSSHISKVKSMLQFLSALFGLILAVCGDSYRGDSVSYLDMGDAFFSGDRQAIFNGLWSPLYPLLLGLARCLIKPSIHWQILAVQLTNWTIFLMAIVAFDFFWGNLLSLYRNIPELEKESKATFSDLQFWVLGYALFLFMHLNLMTFVTPDLLLSAFVYMAAGLLVGIVVRGSTVRRSAALGLALGLGFLAKAIMLPLTAVFIFAAMRSNRRRREILFHAAASIVIFSLVVTPYAIGLSKKDGHFTLGGSGSLNYAWHINGIPLLHWQGQPAGFGKPGHPTRMISSSPAVFEFGEPIKATYAPWYDPSYWNSGLLPRFEWAGQIKGIKLNLGQYLRAFWSQSVLITGLLVLLAMRGEPIRITFLRYLDVWWLWVPAAAALTMYLVIWVEGRYVAQFFVLFWSSVFLMVSIPNTSDCRRLVRIVVVVLVLLMSIRTCVNVVSDGVRRHHESIMQTAQAERLTSYGIQPDSKVATIGLEWADGWQQIAGLRVIAEVPLGEEDSFWTADQSVRDHIFDLIGAAGVRYVIASGIPPPALRPGWVHVDNTQLYVFRLS